MQGSLINRIMEGSNQPVPAVGMGCTICSYTDRHAGTIVGVSASGKTLVVQEDKATRIDKNGMSESQEYRFERNPGAPVQTFRLNKRGQWQARGGYPKLSVGHRDAYHDYSF